MKLIFSLVLCIFLNSCVLGGRSGLGPGEFPPEIKLNSLDGTPISLADFKGKVVLINFWASWCMPCVAEAPAMERLYNRLKNKGFVILAVGIDDEESKLRGFKERFGLTFPIVIDKSGDTKDMYQVSGVPESLLVGRDGKLLMIPDPDDNRPTVRIIGPRNWDSPTVEGRFNNILQQGRP
ncbi:MAG: TlpA disulfide reductase family protein [bacterium]|nr:TlpA disulfide reductase family protein [bacterium]